MRINVWDIERDPTYLAWLREIEDQHPGVPGRPMSKMRHGSSTVGRSLVLAKAGEGGALRLGVELSTADTFWRDWPGTMGALLDQEAAAAAVGADGSQARKRAEVDAFVEAAGGIGGVRLEFCSSHVGGFSRLLGGDEGVLYIEEH